MIKDVAIWCVVALIVVVTVVLITALITATIKQIKGSK